MAAKKPASKKKPKHRTPRPTLSAREVRFCRLYVTSESAGRPNATQCFIDAGLYHGSRASASELAFRLLRRVEIRQCIRRMEQEAVDAEQITVDKLAQSLGHEAFADRCEVFDSRGRFLPPHRWPPELRTLLVGCDVEEETETATETAVRVVDGQEVTAVTTTTTVRVKYKPRFARTTEAKRILAQWRGMIGAEKDATPPAAGSDRVVIENGGTTPDAPAGDGGGGEGGGGGAADG